MSGPKTSSYSLEQMRLMRMASFRRHSEELEQAMNEEIANLAAADPDAAREIENAMRNSGSDRAGSLTEYQKPLRDAIARARKEMRRIEKQANESFAQGVGELVDSNDSVVESASLLLESISEVDAMDRAQAEELLSVLDLPKTPEEESVIRRLKAVVSGTGSLDPVLRADAGRLLAGRQGELAGELAAAALQEIGYEVSGEFSTLFVEGGMVHFQRPEWKDYYVRMRVNPGEQYLNLNMVRVGSPDESRDRGFRDREMEETWCTGYPELMEKFRSLGIGNSRVRELPSGSMAVQPVPAEQLGRKSSAGRKRRTPSAKAMTEGTP